MNEWEKNTCTYNRPRYHSLDVYVILILLTKYQFQIHPWMQWMSVVPEHIAKKYRLLRRQWTHFNLYFTWLIFNWWLFLFELNVSFIGFRVAMGHLCVWIDRLISSEVRWALVKEKGALLWMADATFAIRWIYCVKITRKPAKISSSIKCEWLGLRTPG